MAWTSTVIDFGGVSGPGPPLGTRTRSGWATWQVAGATAAERSAGPPGVGGAGGAWPERRRRHEKGKPDSRARPVAGKTGIREGRGDSRLRGWETLWGGGSAARRGGGGVVSGEAAVDDGLSPPVTSPPEPKAATL